MGVKSWAPFASQSHHPCGLCRASRLKKHWVRAHSNEAQVVNSTPLFQVLPRALQYPWKQHNSGHVGQLWRRTARVQSPSPFATSWGSLGNWLNLSVPPLSRHKTKIIMVPDSLLVKRIKWVHRWRELRRMPGWPREVVNKYLVLLSSKVILYL